MWALSADLRKDAGVETVARELDQSIRIAPITWTLVVRPRAAGKRFEGSAQHGTANGVEKPLEEHGTVLGGVQFHGAVLHIPPLLGLKRCDVMGVAHVSAVISKTTEVVGEREVEQRLLMECRCGGRLAKSACSAGHEREVREPEPSLVDGSVALLENDRLIADRNRAACRRTCHPAVAAHPLDGAAAALPLFLVGAGKGCSDRRELQLDPIYRPPETLQIVAQDLGR
jgi:hypothetical protein